MKAARYYGPGDIRVENIPEPVPRDDEVKVKVAWNGICGSDLSVYLTSLPGVPTASEPNPTTGEKLPITLGHECSGTIVELGPGVDETKWRVGQNVCIEPVLSCMDIGTCVECTQGTRNICPKVTFIGIGGGGGGLAEYITVNPRNVYALPDGVPLEIGAMIEPLAVAWYAVQKSGFKPGAGETVLIVGAGPIGLCILKVLRSLDPDAPIFLSGTNALRLSIAQKHGATVVLNPRTPSSSPSLSSSSPSPTYKSPTYIRDAIASSPYTEHVNGSGVDIVFEAAGTQAGLDDAVGSVRPRGKVVNVSIWEEKPRIDLTMVVMKEVQLLASAAYSGIHGEVIDAVAKGKIKGLEDFITARVGLEDVVRDGFVALLKEKDRHVKILVRP